jgi:hypothetical protein
MCHSGAPFEPSEGVETYERLFREVYRGIYPSLRRAMGLLG